MASIPFFIIYNEDDPASWAGTLLLTFRSLVVLWAANVPNKRN